MAVPVPSCYYTSDQENNGQGSTMCIALNQKYFVSFCQQKTPTHAWRQAALCTKPLTIPTFRPGYPVTPVQPVAFHPDPSKRLPIVQTACRSLENRDQPPLPGGVRLTIFSPNSRTSILDLRILILVVRSNHQSAHRAYQHHPQTLALPVQDTTNHTPSAPYDGAIASHLILYQSS